MSQSPLPRLWLPIVLWLGLTLPALPATTNLSAWVFPTASGRLVSQPDALGNRILDFSGIGYRAGTVPLPSSNMVPVKVVVSPVSGDNVANIQNAINQVSALPLDTNGFRGAVLLSAGLYPCAKTLKISASGVVLRGVGTATNGTGTVLEATATNQYTLIQITGSGSAVSGTTRTITNLYVPVGARSFYVDNTNGLSLGAEVFVRRVATSNWIHDLGMDLLGPPPDVPWTASGYNIDMDRVITHLEGNQVFVDAPITCAIDARYANGTIRPFTWTGLLTNVGVEHLYAKSDYFGSNTNETHGWTCVQFDKTVHGWARDVVSQYFGYSCVNLNSGDRFITLQDCQSLDPISIITGGRRYAFTLNDAQYCLVKNCYTRQDRHQFVTESVTIGPNAFVDGLSDSAHGEAGPHQRWATGILWDHITVHGGNNDIQNAGNYGTGHGWEGANCVIWNNAANGFIVQDPPGAHNWLIGSIGPIQNGTAWNIGYPNMPHAPGEYDSSGSGAARVFPDSLYFSQLQDRLAAPNLQSRDYWLGDIDLFANASGGEKVSLDLTWSNAVRSAAAGQALDRFDVVTNNHWVPFTFNYSLAPNERIVAATLALSLRALSSAVGDALYLNGTTNPVTFSSLGWLPVATGTNSTVRLLDLSGQLNLLTNGQLNVAAQGDLGIDWAMLELQVAPNAVLTATSLSPVGDATVRGGTSAGLNFGSATTLTVRQDASANNVQQAYLHWDLSGVPGKIAQARVVLTPVSVPANALEQGAAVARAGNWTESSLTWNNQPGYGERFATWLAAAGGQISFDVTPQVLDALANDQQLSLALFSVGTNSVDYASRENSNPASRPQLLLWQLGTPPALSSISDRTIAPNTSTGPIAFTISGTTNTGLTLSADSSNPALVPALTILFGGSGTNRTVTVTPTANQTGAALITLTVTDPSGVSASSSFTLTVSSHPASVMVWNGPGAGANTWSAPGHWSPAQVPEFLDEVKFFDAGASGVAVSNVNNLVDAGFGGNLASLQYGNTNGNHTTALAPGTTLSLAGANGLIAGTETDNGSAQTLTATITGSAGTLQLNNSAASLVVRQGAAGSGGSQRATLDLSGLGTFNASLNQVLVGSAGPVNRATGTLYLGKTNTLTLSGSPGICVGDNRSNGGGQNLLYLGNDNSIYADSLTIGRQKANGSLRFNPGSANPVALFRASDGVSRVDNWNIADNSAQSTSSSSSLGTNDFTGGTVDALVDTLVVGKSQTTTGASSYGVLTFTSGIFDINTLQVGYQAQSGATSGGIGRVNVSGPNAQLVVNSLLELGHTSGGTGTSNTFGTLFVNGGSVWANAIVAGSGSGPNLLALNAGSLVVAATIGSSAAPVSLVTLTNSTLQFSVLGGGANLVAASLTTGGGSNALWIASLPPIGSTPVQFPMLQYSGTIGGNGFNFILGAWPTDALYGGYLSNNLAGASVDLVITNYLRPDPFLTWNGNLNGDWDTETANWKDNLSTDLTYAEGTAVLFNDSALGATTVNLTDTFMPASVTVSNNIKSFTFAGPGNLSGDGGLTKQGSGTLVLANSGPNDFAGGIAVQAGTLQVGSGGPDGSLPANPISNDGSLVFNVSTDLTVSGTITGTGSLTQQGSGTLTLSGANTYSGPTTIRQGTLKAANASALGIGASITFITNAGTLDVNGLNLTAEPITVSGPGANTNGAIVNSGASQTSALRTVTLAGDVTFGGTSRWDIRNTGGTASLLSGGQPFKITKVGTNQVSLVAVNPIDAMLGDIDIQQGVFAIQTSTTQVGNPGNTITVRSNATLELWALSASPLNKQIVLEDGATVWNESGSSVIIGPMLLQSGSATVNVGGTSLTVSNSVLSGPGALTKTGAGTLTLRGANTYTGDTLVNAGTLALAGAGSVASSANVVLSAGALLDVSARSDAKLTLFDGQTLSGAGTLNGSLLVSSNATLSPGPGMTTLTVANAVTLQGTTCLELNRAANTNDALRGASIAYGGILSLTNLAGTLARGDAFPLFNAASYSAAFNRLVPPTAGPGLVWDTHTLLTDGTLRVAAAPRPVLNSVSISAGSLVFSSTNGVPNAPCYLLTSTNLALPTAAWTRLTTNVFDNTGALVVTNAINPSAVKQFYLLQLP